MAKTIEIKGETLVKLAAVLIGLGLMIYFLNNYDRKEKSALLIENIELIQNSKSFADVKRILEQQDTMLDRDQLTIISGVTDNLNNKINGTDRHYYRGARISGLIFYADGNYFQSNVHHNMHRGELKGKFKKVILPEETLKVIDEIRENETDLNQILTEMNKGKRKQQIILPFKSEKWEWYLEFHYWGKS